MRLLRSAFGVLVLVMPALALMGCSALTHPDEITIMEEPLGTPPHAAPALPPPSPPTAPPAGGTTAGG